MTSPPPARSAAPASVGCLIFVRERLLRELLTSLLAIRAGIHVATNSGSVADGKRACGEHAPDVLIVALSRSDDGSLDVARAFTTHAPNGRVILLVDSGEHFEPPAWLAENISGIIDRNDPVQRLWSLIDQLMPAARQAGDGGLRRRLGGRSLSQRESQVFTLIGEGFTNSQIAQQLQLSDHTVRTHRKRIAAKLGTEGTALTRWAIVSRQASLDAASDG